MRLIVDPAGRSVNGKLGSLAKEAVPVVLGRLKKPNRLSELHPRPDHDLPPGISDPAIRFPP
jgi:hypothetical protein